MQLPCYARLPNSAGLCQKPVVHGHNRCRLHGGASTGIRSADGMERRIAALVAGRARWAAKLKAKGKPFPNSRKGRPNRTPEQRAALAQAKAERAAARQRYSEQRTMLETLKSKSRTIRSLIPAYIKKSDFDNPRTNAKIEQALRLAKECSAFPMDMDSELGSKVIDQQLKIWKSVISVQFEYSLEAERRQKEQKEKEWYQRIRQMALQAYGERSRERRNARAIAS